MSETFILDGATVPFAPGQTVLQAALAAGHYIPHLCYHPEFKPHGSCKLCTVKANGRTVSGCTMPVEAGMEIESNIEELNTLRRTLLQMLFVEGNHFCPSCEASGNCQLQATAYAMQMMTPRFNEFYPDRPLDGSHPDILLDYNRCILCELCVRASSEVDKKNVFALAGRGITKHLIVNAESGLLKDTGMALEDKAMQVCPVGVFLRKGAEFSVPIGKRRYDQRPVSAQALDDAPRQPAAGSCDSCEGTP